MLTKGQEIVTKCIADEQNNKCFLKKLKLSSLETHLLVSRDIYKEHIFVVQQKPTPKVSHSKNDIKRD